ncbi:CheW domain-containing protein [Azomonas macrocytogenes]|uniref:Purine-binding chemotaxis protein CheW n=1 Tax=Azomonas macrocytogenes TaxID=69962 RepID=A0A839T249_AZOMA|nr:CheW domain-containing protein [Azomonas macrocytogenes]MBB3101813.1 purine-binding chemotaxis protein CheW [Azomonas macrocytogenes]
MSRIPTAIPPQVALQSYLDDLLQEATDPAGSDAPLSAESVSHEEFAAAVREERLRDGWQTRNEQRSSAAPLIQTAVSGALPVPLSGRPQSAAANAAAGEPESLPIYARPVWSEAPFECLLFDVAGLTLAVPLICLGSIHPLKDEELTPLFGQPDWFLGILPRRAGNLKVVDTARWLLGERYREAYRQGLKYLISLQGCEWGLAVHQVSHSIHLEARQIKWRTQRNQRPWLAGTVIDRMCALLDVAVLAELIAAGGERDSLAGNPPRT